MFRDYRRIEGYPDYIVSNYGEVYSTKKQITEWRELKGGYNRGGYKQVFLFKDGKRKKFTVHVLVGNAFIGKREDGLTFDHWPDRTKINNRADNIRLATHSEQNINKGVMKTNKSGEKNISTSFKKGHEYYLIHIIRNKKRVFQKYLNKKKWKLEDAVKERDDFLLTL